MTRFAEGPGDPYKATVDGLWPQLGDEAPRQYAWDQAYGEVATRTMAYTDPDTGQLKFVPKGQPDPLRDPMTCPLLWITCLPEGHFGHAAPVLAEVWQTTRGRLFVAALPGTLLDPDESSRAPFAPPAAARAARRRRRPAAASAEAGQPWIHVPITIVRLLLDDDVPAGLWVRCVRHGPAQVDRDRLQTALEKMARSPNRDAPEVPIVRLDSVTALSSG